MRRFLKKIPAILTVGVYILLLLLSTSQVRAQSISLTNIGVPYVQDFNTLSSATGTTNNTLSINGWYMNETGTGANGLYGVDNGSLFTGDVYSYGIASPGGNFADRALGTMHSGTFTPVIGAKFTNNTGYTITSLVIWYKGEQWRIGQQNVVDKLIFSYSTNATDVVTGTYTPVPALDLPSPISVGGAGAPVDGNQFTFKIINGTITGLNIPVGATFWIHWTDQANAGLNDALSVDEFSLTPMAPCSTIETFEGFTAGTTNFTSGGINFSSQTTNFSVDELPPYGFHGSDKFFDNFTGNPNPCRLTATTPFRLKSLYVYPSDLPDGHDPQTSGVNIKFTGKRAGVQKFEYAPAAATFAGANANDPANRGFTLVNFAVSGYQDIAIDELIVTLGGTTVYFAIDNMSFCSGACNTITVTNPAITTGTKGTPFSQSFTQSGGALAATFTTASTLPSGLTLSTAGVLSGTPTQTGTFPITVTVTDANGCVQAGSAYNLVIACPTITVSNPATTTGTVGTAFSQNFTASGGTSPYTYTTTSTLPTGITLSTAGVLSGTPTQSGSFPIVVKATDASACFGNSTTYTLLISCQTINITNPAVTTGTNGAPFSQTFTQTGGLGSVSFTTSSTLPAGITLSTTGILSGTPTAGGTFPITVTATDMNGCAGTGNTYTLVIATCTAVNQTFSASPTSLCPGGSSTITVGASQAGVNYTLRVDPANTFVAGPTASNGPAIAFNTGPIASTITYNVLAETDKYSINVNGGQIGVVIPQVSQMNLTNNFTIESWIKPAGNVGSARILDKDLSYALGLSSNQTQLTFTNHLSGDFSRPFNFVNGTWYHVACTYVSGTVEFFVNGVSIGTVSGVPPIPTQNFGANIGAEAGGFNFFKGNIDNVRLWNSVRSSLEISTNQSAFLTSTGNPTLVASWWMIEGAGNPKDYSANAIHSTGFTGSWQVDSPVAPCNIVLTNKPTVSITPNNTITLTSAASTTAQTVCINSPITNITYSTISATGATFSGLPAGVTGNWAANVVTISGSPSVTGSFSYIITLTGGCGTITANGTIGVNPIPTVNSVSNQTVCKGSSTSAITLSGGPGGTVFNWTNNTPSIGLAANGTGDIASFTAVNTGITPLVATITVTPGFTNAGVTCTGSPITFTITVNPTPDASASPGSQTICSGTAITGITVTGSVTGTVYNWVRNNTGSVTGIAASGTGNISGTLTNTTNAAVMVSFTITPSYTNAGTTCNGTPITATVTVNPNPDVVQPANQVICNNGTTAPVNFTGSVAGTTFNWTNNTTSIGLAANGSGNISAFTGTNATNAPVTSTITVTPSIGGAGFAYIPNFISGDITIINTTTDQATTIPFPGSNPIGAAVSSDGTRAYIGNQNGNIAIINTATNTIIGTTPFIGSAPFAVAVSPDGKKVYSANQSAAPNVGIFNTQTNMVETPAVAGNISRGITITPNGNFAYVANAFSDDVSVINTATKATVATIPVGDLPSEAAVSPDGSRVYIANNLSNDVTVINTATNVVIATFGVGAYPSGLALNPSGTRLYVVNQNSNDVLVYNTATFAFIAGFAVGSSPRAVAITPDGTKGYVTNGSSNNVSVFNTTTNTVIATVPVGNIPWGAGGGKFISPPLPLCTGTPKTFTITVNPTATINAVSNQTVCNNTLTAAINFSSPTTGGSIVYNWTNTNAAIGLASSGSGNISAFTVTNLTTSPISGTITVTPAYTNGGTTCNGTPITFTINVNPTNTITLTSAAGTNNQTVLIGTPITNITYATTSATGATFSGLPPGVTANWAGNVVNISGTPTVEGVFNYTVTLTGGCGNITATGTINVIICSITRTSAVGTDNQVLCNNTAITNITYATTGATGATFSGLPTGVTGNWAANVVTISGTPSVSGTFNYTITPTGGGCSGMITATGTITVNPIPTVNAVANQVLCNGTSTAAVNFSGTPAGVVYNWTNTTSSIGLAASGTGNIAVFTAINATNAPVTATVTATPTFTNLGVTCTGSPITFTYTVNPTPTVNAVANQVLCNSTSSTAVNFTGFAPGTVYNWTNNTPSIGLASSGTGNISSFTATNATNVAITATITVTPTFTNAGVTCTGTPITFTITVNPTPTVNAVANQVLCNTASTTAVNFTGFVPGTVYNWTNNTPSIGLASSGTGNISSFTATNVTSAPVIATVTVTPTFTNMANTCTGTPITYTYTVNPTPTVNTVANQVLCNNTSTTAVTFTGFAPGTVYNWTNNTPSIGLASSGTGNISSFTATNATNAAITETITVTPTFTNAGVTCTGTPLTFMITVNPTPTVNAVANQTLCNTASTTAVTFTGFVPGTVYNWTNNTPSIGLASSGTGNIASFTAMNATNAPVIATVTVTPSYTNAGVTCTGTPITFTYTVNPTPNAVATPSTQTICSAASISTIVLTGAVSGTTYAWTRDNNASVTGIAASGSGNITGALINTTTAPVTVTFTITPTANSCPGPAITATVLVNPTPNAVATPPSQTICSAATITPIVLTGGVTGTTYAWTRDNNASVTGIAASGSGNITGALTNTTTAPVTVTFTITPTANSCPGASITATVLVSPTPNAVATPSSQTICSAATISTIVLTGAVSGTTYAWTRDNTASVTGIAASGSGNISGTLTNTTTTPVTVTFTITPTANSCPGASITATVLVNPTPNAVATPASQTICSAATITTIVLTGAVTGTTYAWTRDNTASVTGITASGSGNISGALTNTTSAPVTVTFTVTPTANSCPGPAITATVLVNPTPNAVATPASQTICSAATISTIVLTGAVSGTTYAWTRDNTASVTGIAASGSGNISGTLTNTTTAPVTVTFTITPTANGCGGPAITATVLVNPTPNAVATPASQTICSGSGITSIVLTGAVTGTTYAWTRNNTATVTGIAASGSGNISGTLTNTTSAPVTVTFTITPTANGCPGPAITATVLVNPTPNAVATPASQGICTNNYITPIVLTGSVAGTAFNWTRNNTATVTGIAAFGSGNISGILVNNTAAPITVTFTITPTANGCTGNAITATVIVNPTPIGTISISPNPGCVGSTVQLSASGGTTYLWSGPQGFASTLQNPTILLTTYQQGGQYSVTITSGTGCSVVKYATLKVNYPPIATATYEQNTACTGSTLKLHGNGAGAYAWSGPAGFTSNLKDPVIVNVTSANSGLYTLTVTSPNGCTATTTINVTINTPPVVSANPTLTQTCEGSTVQLTASGTGSFSWSGPAGWVSINQNPVINNIPLYMSGTFTVTLTANTGCSSTASVTIKVYEQIKALATATPNPVCQGQSLQLHAEGGSQYLWTGPAGFNSSESDPRIDNITLAHAGSYYVFISNEGGCSGYAEVKVEVKPTLKGTAGATPNPVQEFSQVQFTSSDGVSHSWTGPLGFTSTLQNPQIKKVTRAMAGIYTVMIINENGCPTIVKVNLKVNYTNKVTGTTDENIDGNDNLDTRSKKISKVYPNPTNDYLYFESESSAAIQYMIFDLSGKEHVTLTTTTDSYISTSNLPSGVYQIRWKPQDSEMWINSRFVKIR